MSYRKLPVKEEKKYLLAAEAEVMEKFKRFNCMRGKGQISKELYNVTFNRLTKELI